MLVSVLCVCSEDLANGRQAALCADAQEKQGEILEILDKVLHISKFPSRSILDDLVKVWTGGS